jgi:hypothetical protein
MYEYKKVVELRKLCVQRKIKNYGNLRKSELIERLKQYDDAKGHNTNNNETSSPAKPKLNWQSATEFYQQLRVGLNRPLDSFKNIYATRIQKWYRLNRQRKKNVKCVNDKCAFTLEPMSRWCYRFVHIVTENQIFQFDPDLLTEYMLTSGQFRNPFTRTPFNNVELNRLTQLIRLNKKNDEKWKNMNLAAIRTVIQRQRQQEQENIDTLNFLQNECLRAFECILSIGRQNIELNVDFLLGLCEDLLVIFIAHMDNLAFFNRQYAEELMTNYTCQIQNLELRGGPLRMFYKQVRCLFTHYTVARFHMPPLENNDRP